MTELILDKASVELMVGMPGSRLPRLPRSKQLKIRAWLKTAEPEHVLTPEMSIRAKVLSGVPVEKEFLNERVLASALTESDLLRHANRLSLPTTTIDFSVVFRVLEQVIRESPSPLPSQRVRRICLGLQRWSRWVASKNAVLSAESATVLADLLSILLRRAASRKGSGKNVRKWKQSLTELSLSLACTATGASISQEVCVAYLRLLQSLRMLAGKDVVDELVSREAVERWSVWLSDGTGKLFEELARLGHLDDLKGLAVLSEEHPRVLKAIRSTARRLWDEEAAVLPEPVQEWLQRYLGIKASALGEVEFVSRSERPEISQLAAALLRSWDARNDSRTANEAFQVLEDVCKRFFNVRLGGAIGATVRMDPRLYEVEGGTKPEDILVIRRPWVEWREGEAWKVIIRGVIGKP